MNFYRLTSSHIGGRKFPWVGHYGPLDPMEKMLFFKNMPESFQARKLQSWEINKHPPGLSIDPGGRTWSDFIGCGGGPPSHFVSERVICDLNEAHIPILRVTEMPIAEISAKALQKIPPLKYFVLEAAPGIVMDWKKMGVPHDENNKLITNPYPKPWPPKQMIVNLSTWNGSDLLSYSNFQTTITLICTERVKELAEEKGWTNVKFDPVQAL